VEYANVVFDHRRKSAVTTIRRWAAKRDIVLAGRYGLWEYLWSDDAVLSGYAAADVILTSPSQRSNDRLGQLDPRRSDHAVE
jgi:hypothetical protein